MQLLKVKDLNPHPKNNYFFDDMSGQKWNEFLESVRTSGVIEPIVATQDKTTGDLIIISGHQRTRASIELGEEEIMCDIKVYDNEDSIIKDLIETNIRQRGDVSSSSLKMGRIIKELERIYEIKKGGGRPKIIGDNATNYTQQDIASKLGISIDTYKDDKKLLELIPELQDLLIEGKLTTSVASRILARLPQNEQDELLKELGQDKITKMTQKQMQEYINKIYEKERETEQLKQELEVEKNKSKEKEYVETVVDNTDYTIVNKLNKIEEELKNKTIESDKLKTKLELMTNKADAYEKDSINYSKMKDEITYLTQQKDDLGRKIQSITDISGLVVEIDNLIKQKLAPIKYSKSLLEARDDKIVVKNLTDIVETVQQWCDEIKEYLPNKINYVEVIK